MTEIDKSPDKAALRIVLKEIVNGILAHSNEDQLQRTFSGLKNLANYAERTGLPDDKVSYYCYRCDKDALKKVEGLAKMFATICNTLNDVEENAVSKLTDPQLRNLKARLQQEVNKKEPAEEAK